MIAAVVWGIETLVDFIIFTDHSLRESLLPLSSIHEFYMRILILVACCILYLLLDKNKIIQEKEKEIENILDNVIPVCITNKNFEIVRANESYWRIWGEKESAPLKCYEHRPGSDCYTERCAMQRILNGAEIYECESQKRHGNETHHFIVTAKPFLDAGNRVVGIIESFQDITERINLEKERTELIGQLQSSLEKVKFLSGLLPICSNCKKIRDDKGYWNQIEIYIREHSEADFSHSLCPECVRELYPDYMSRN